MPAVLHLRSRISIIFPDFIPQFKIDRVLLELIEQHLPLDWQTSEEELNLDRQYEAMDCILPTEDKLVELLELVTSGKMKDLKQQIELLESF